MQHQIKYSRIFIYIIKYHSDGFSVACTFIPLKHSELNSIRKPTKRVFSSYLQIQEYRNKLDVWPPIVILF